MKFLSALVTQGSGVMGNLVVEKNGVIRTRNIPANPNSPSQVQARARVTAFAIDWRDTLTQPQRDAWNAYASTVTRNDVLGKPIKLSGIDMYVAGNAMEFGAVLGPFTAGPTTVGALLLPQVLSIVADDSANTVVVTFAADVPANVAVNLYVSPAPVSPGRTQFTGPYRFVQTQPGAAAPAVTFTSVTAPVAGDVIGWRVKAYDSEGRVSRDQTGLTTVVA